MNNFASNKYYLAVIFLILLFFINPFLVDSTMAAGSYNVTNNMPSHSVKKLPRVLLIGDSISIAYAKEVRNYLTGKAFVFWNQENATDTRNGLRKIKNFIGKKHWDVIHFNWGLHDLRCINKIRSEKCIRKISLSEYKDNLGKIIKNLKMTNAKLIFATTTPFGKGVHPPRIPQDVKIYNAAAVEVMRTNGIPINDLFSFAEPRLSSIQIPDNVHFNYEGSKLLAKIVSERIYLAIGSSAY